MNDLSAQQFLQIVLEADPGTRTIVGGEISYLRTRLKNNSIPIRPHLSSIEFYAVAKQYPHNIQVTETRIEINNGAELYQKLNNQLMYSQDKKVNKAVLKIWKGRKGY